MNIPKLVMALLILSATSCDRAPADPSRPDAFALQLPLKPAADGALQRLTLPAEALVALQRRDLGDVRRVRCSGQGSADRAGRPSAFLPAPIERPRLSGGGPGECVGRWRPVDPNRGQ